MEPQIFPAPDPGAGAACMFCSFGDRFPELVVHEESDWVLAHMHDFLPLGSVLLFPKQHGLLPQVSVESWGAGAPMIALAANMLTECSDAERVYMLSFSEFNYHFHFAIMPKSSEMQALHDGKVGLNLLGELLSRTPLPTEDVRRVVHAYRAYASRFSAARGAASTME